MRYSFHLFVRRSLLAGWLMGLLLSACQHSPKHSTASMPAYQTEKFRLSASPAAADGYTATIDEARFLTSTGSFPVPWGYALDSGWGSSGTGWAVGDDMQSAPDSLEIRWFSYAENKFYEGHFLLPQERIYQLLKQGYWNPELRKQETYYNLVVCTLPVGGVVVWLRGSYNTVLIGRYQAAEIGYDYARHRPQVDRVLDVQETRAAMPAQVRAEIAAGTVSSKKWDAYLKYYPWQVEFSQPVTLTEFTLATVSAEIASAPPTPDWITYGRETLLAPSLKAIPMRCQLYITGAYGRKRLFKVSPFDEAETMAAFQTLHAKYPQQPLVLHIETDERLTEGQLSLRAGGQVIPLTQSKVQVFSIE